ncbi:hypothetical protein [Frankia sp. Cj5]|nr:hypothetical protein [Frankia sp. Cj5]
MTPDRVTQLALARALDVPADRVDAQPWPRWLPTGDAGRGRLAFVNGRG